jgi:hypothetical protein
MNHRQSPSIPPELVGIVAKFIAEGGHARRSKAIVACRQVCRMFAQEFRPHLFKNLYIHDFQGSDGRLKKLYKIVLKEPALSMLVKRVNVALTASRTATSRRSLEIADSPQFAQLLNLLHSVTSLSLSSTAPGEIFPLKTCAMDRGKRFGASAIWSPSSTSPLIPAHPCHLRFSCPPQT